MELICPHPALFSHLARPIWSSSPKGLGVGLEEEDTGPGGTGCVCELASLARCLTPSEDEVNVDHSPDGLGQTVSPEQPSLWLRMSCRVPVCVMAPLLHSWKKGRLGC